MRPSRETIAGLRFGYGFGPGEAGPLDAAGLMAELHAGAAAPGPRGPGAAERLALLAAYDEAKRRKAPREERRRLGMPIRRSLARDARRRVIRAATSRHPFFDRLSWFWADHFSVAAKNMPSRALAGAFEQEAIRPHLAGRFADLLRAAETHPAMLLFLDQTRSVGPLSAAGRKRGRGLNENLAREVIELHTLGVGAPYTQDDVRQFAELLTGLDFDRETGAPRLRRDRAEPGAETVLGRSYGGSIARIEDIHAALDDLAAHPATARHIALKLARHFVADAPPEPLVAHVEAAFRRSGGDLPSVYAALLEHEASWENFGAKARQPVDFLAASIRSIGPTREDLAEMETGEQMARADSLPLFGMLRRLNQTPLDPPGPQGWPEEAEAWINPQGLSARIDWASRLARLAAPRWDPRDFLASALRDAAAPETDKVVSGAAERWEGIALVLASPEFNRR